MNDKKQERWIYAVALLIPVVWFALLTAPCLGGTIIDVMKRLTEAIKSPLHIVWCENSLKCILVFLGLYAFGILLYLGSKGNTRDGEEHGSAKWGTPQELNKELKQKTNFPLSKEIRLGMDTRSRKGVHAACERARRLYNRPIESYYTQSPFDTAYPTPENLTEKLAPIIETVYPTSLEPAVSGAPELSRTKAPKETPSAATSITPQSDQCSRKHHTFKHFSRIWQGVYSNYPWTECSRIRWRRQTNPRPKPRLARNLGLSRRRRRVRSVRSQEQKSPQSAQGY